MNTKNTEVRDEAADFCKFPHLFIIVRMLLVLQSDLFCIWAVLQSLGPVWGQDHHSIVRHSVLLVCTLRRAITLPEDS